MTCCVGGVPDFQNKEGKKEPLVDLVDLIEQLAWKKLEEHPPKQLTLTETFQRKVFGLQKVCYLEVDKAFITVSHPNKLSLHAGPVEKSQTEQPKLSGESVPAKTETEEISTADTGQLLSNDEHTTEVCRTSPLGLAGLNMDDAPMTFLFDSHFRNQTGEKQAYSFKTERQTRSVVEMSLQKGFTMGHSLDLNVKIPTGVKGFKLSGKLGHQMQWSFTKGQVSRQEESVTWSVDSHVVVEGGKTGKASLEVEELRWTSDFSLDCVIHPRRTLKLPDEPDDDMKVVRFPVFVRRRSTGQVIKVEKLSRYAIINARPCHFQEYDQDDSGIVCRLEGICNSVCAVNQRVSLTDGVLTPDSQRAGPIVRQTSEL